jgi:hypothetical protein
MAKTEVEEIVAPPMTPDLGQQPDHVLREGVPVRNDEVAEKAHNLIERLDKYIDGLIKEADEMANPADSDGNRALTEGVLDRRVAEVKSIFGFIKGRLEQERHHHSTR